MVSLRKHIALLSILITAGCSASAQNWEFGGMIGASNYHGDLAYNIVPKESHMAQGIHIRYNFTPYWSYKPSIMHCKISGSDANFPEYQMRNLSFQSDIWEVSNALEFNFVPFGSRILSKNFSSYATLGIAVFRHNPKTEYEGELYTLRNLRTEGQTSETQYGLLQLAIPFGGGVKYNINKNIVLGWELAWRKTFTDYLDDVSTVYPDLDELRDQRGDLAANLSDRSWEMDGVGAPQSVAGDERGDPAMKDFYFFTGITLTYRLTPITCWPKRKREIIWK